MKNLKEAIAKAKKNESEDPRLSIMNDIARKSISDDFQVLGGDASGEPQMYIGDFGRLVREYLTKWNMTINQATKYFKQGLD